jgi:sigma-B regulation protein RsbU (phosphoserine phosphatase)
MPDGNAASSRESHFAIRSDGPMNICSENIALGIQTKLLQSFIDLVRSSDQAGMLKATLQKTVDLAAEITGAEAGSLFLLEKEGVVSDCLTMRETASDEDRAQSIGTVLDKGLAGWVVRNRKVGLSADTRQDPRWVDLPDQPYSVRSAIVTPILKGPSLFGILSLVHSRPGQFSEDTAALLEATAAHIAIVLENAKLYDHLNEAFHEIEKAKKTIETYSNALTAELEKGRHMQRTFLPAHLPAIPGWRVAACFHPAQQVSGDFYDIFPMDDNHLGIIIADVCDKGVSAALFIGIFKSLLRSYLEGAPAWRHRTETLRRGSGAGRHRSGIMEDASELLNRYIEKHHGQEGIFATLFLATLDTHDGRLDYVNAGHEPLILAHHGHIVGELAPTGPAIGMAANSVFKGRSIVMTEGDTLIGFTDGVTEACGDDGIAFSRSGVHDAIADCHGTGGVLINCILEKVFKHLKGSDPTDDIAMIEIRRTGL